MGKATRWFRSILGLKKDKEHTDNSSNTDRKDKKRWSFGKSGRDSGDVGQIQGTNIPPAEAAWLRSYYTETEIEQNKHAIAVAAAQAAVAVVRLTSHGRGTMFGGGRERWAAAKIQIVFRGYLVSGVVLDLFLIG
ncbi:IQ-domain [Ranunculus cassubicifolius]